MIDIRLLSHQNYVLDLFNETSMLRVKPNTPTEHKVTLNGDDSLVLFDEKGFITVVDKLIYVTITISYITCPDNELVHKSTEADSLRSSV